MPPNRTSRTVVCWATWHTRGGLPQAARAELAMVGGGAAWLRSTCGGWCEALTSVLGLVKPSMHSGPELGVHRVASASECEQQNLLALAWQCAVPGSGVDAMSRCYVHAIWRSRWRQRQRVTSVSRPPRIALRREARVSQHVVVCTTVAAHTRGEGSPALSQLAEGKTHRRFRPQSPAPRMRTRRIYSCRPGPLG
jgi:hypothetical protein